MFIIMIILPHFFKEKVALWEVKNVPPFYGTGRLSTACAPKLLRFVLILPYRHPLFSRGLFYFGFSKKVLWILHIFLVLATCLSRTILFRLIAMIFGDQQSLLNLLLCTRPVFKVRSGEPLKITHKR